MHAQSTQQLPARLVAARRPRLQRVDHHHERVLRHQLERALPGKVGSVLRLRDPQVVWLGPGEGERSEHEAHGVLVAVEPPERRSVSAGDRGRGLRGERALARACAAQHGVDLPVREAADDHRQDRGVLGDDELVGVVGAKDANARSATTVAKRWWR